MERSNPKIWRAVLRPHRSLSRQGFIVLMLAVAFINFTGGVMFYLAGAWPVAGFMGLDVALLWWAFNRNFADARRSERIEISETEVLVETRRDGQENQQQRFVRAWVRVELEEDIERELIGGLFLRSHGRKIEIGRFLGPAERKGLAGELRKALATRNI